MDMQGATVNPVDASSRITLRDHQVDELDGKVILTQGFDENLYMFSPEQWPQFAEKLGGASRWTRTWTTCAGSFVGAAIEVELDDRGRMKIPGGAA
jgi:DNA-binding transcriptional regulator/RsmH inhibitor MraZ